MRPTVAEAIGTFALVFVGTGAIVVDDLSGGAVTHPGVALAFGLVVAAMIYTVGDVSGAHFNPAVTLGFWAARRLPGRDVGRYIGSQCAGAVTASALVWALFPEGGSLGATVPSGPLLQSFVLEIVLTFLLVFVILGVTTSGTADAPAKQVGAGAAIGATVALCALFGGPISGASMNPARSLGPALFGSQLGVLWLYVVAPTLGGLLAVGGCRLMRGKECCGSGAQIGCVGSQQAAAGD